MPERFTKSIIVKASPATVYGIWSQFENFPQFMDYIKSVTKMGPKMSRWEMAGPLGLSGGSRSGARRGPRRGRGAGGPPGPGRWPP